MDDLTASHWDDVLAPSQKPFSDPDYNDMTSSFGNLNTGTYGESTYNHRRQSETSGDSDTDNGEDGDNAETANSARESNPMVATANSDHSHAAFASSSVFNQAELDQLQELQKEERKEKTSNLLLELTSGDGPDLEQSLVSPSKVDASSSLFSDRGTPLKVAAADTNTQEHVTSPTRGASLKNGKFRAPRNRKYAAKTVVKHLRESADDSLGPLGGSAAPAEKEDHALSRADILVQEADAPLYEIGKDSDDQRVQKLAAEAPPRAETPTATNGNDLEISVGDPVKVGDITTAHIVYSLRTRNRNADSEHFPTTEAVTVSRRYKDFRWIYHQLQNNHPGRIVPPPPTKQTYIGRFNESFIENRRMSLEKMLVKISRVGAFADDPDFVMFLTSEDFANESKERERISGSGASTHPDPNDDDTESVSNSSSSGTPLVSGTAASSFMSSLFSISTKLPEPDEFFSSKKAYLDDLEHNLKTFHKSLELIATQRVEIIGVTEEIATTIDAIADLEMLKTTTDLLGAFADVHMKLRENLDRVNLQDQLTLGFTVEEYLRIIGSVKYVFDTRSRIYQQYTSFKSDLAKKQESLDRLNAKYKSSVDKINLLTFEVDKLKQKVAHYEKSFTSISDTIRSELDNFETEKIDDFRNSVEIFIESSIESQKEAIELWETFYERHQLAQV